MTAALRIGDRVHVHATRYNNREVVLDFDGVVVKLGALYVWVSDGVKPADCYKECELTLIGQPPMKVIDVCAGLGGFSVGLELAGGFETVAFVENHSYRQQLLNKRWPAVPVLEDVKYVTQHSLRSIGVSTVDVFTAGFPCQ